ncbi:phosphoadenosine phosphosulfate reductase domain-containing protein [Methanocaldococcus infernus]|uniref:phosphoadenosine phosphosulfate reductase domain-containing protein n=1 Tax=Methanocaldococcus infernus TaxID=67760 RepID=UPI00064E3C0A|nr:phosphoadenosine phosphosulfate reductase family protein [Methanocaldococcus infernus]
MEFSKWTKEKRKLNNLEELKRDILEQFKENNCLNKKIVAMVSGGKDSSTALALALDLGLEVKYLVHFTHRWSWDICKEEVMKLSDRFGIEVKFIDITEELLKRIKGAKPSSICRICKNIMKDKAVDIAKREDSIILTGDSALEKVSGAIMNYLRRKYGEVKYNKMELTKVPEKYNIFFFRPLIRLAYEDVLKLMKYYNLNIRRVHEVGDKKFWREGCCLQYAKKLDEETFNKLYLYNKIATEVAREHNFRASVKYPPLEIITVPNKEEYKELIMKRLRELE